MHNLGLNKLWKPAKFGCEVIDPAGWSAEHISERNDWIYKFSQSDIGELKNAIRTYDKPGLNLLSLNLISVNPDFFFVLRVHNKGYFSVKYTALS